MTRLPTAVLALALAAALAPAADAPKKADAKKDAKPAATAKAATPAAKPAAKAMARPGSDVQDVVFLGKSRPVLIRLHVQIDGKPAGTAWNEYMKRLFDYFDLDGNGVLDRKEAARVPHIQVMRYQFQGVIGYFGNFQLAFSELDRNNDGKVTPDEFADYYRRNGLSPFRLGVGPDRGSSDRLTDAMFEHLDTNKDGKLSQAEVAAAYESLRRLDLDEDETVTVNELVAGIAGSPFGIVRQADENNVASVLEKSGVLVLQLGEVPAGRAAQVIRHYDKDHNGRLSRAEVGLDAATFDRLDANKDGQLDATEIAKWLAGPADIEMVVRLGSLASEGGNVFATLAKKLGQGPAGRQASIEIVKPAGKTPSVAGAVRKMTDDKALLTLGDAAVELERNPNQNYFGNKQFYLQQFKATVGKNKYMERKQAMGSPYFQGLFGLADRDGDGKLYEKELVAWLDLQEKGASSFVQLTITEFGRGLFERIDANGDGRLSRRELRAAWSKLAAYCKDGAVAREALPRQFQVHLSRGNMYFQGRFANLNAGPYQGGAPVSLFGGAGPAWFRKMDRNGDGDVSPNEFLGTPEDFKRIDTDGDGLIDAKEASRADSWFKERLEKARKAAEKKAEKTAKKTP